MNQWALLNLNVLSVETFIYKDDFLSTKEKLEKRGTPVMVLAYDTATYSWNPTQEAVAAASWTPQETWVGGEGGDA